MSFPYSYKNTIQSNYFAKNTEEYDEQKILKEVLKKLSSFRYSNLMVGVDSFSFNTKNSLVGFKYKLKVNVYKTEVFNVEYEFNTLTLFQITLLIIVFSAFFTNFSFYTLLIFIALVSVVFYAVNLFYINYSVKRAVRSLPIFRIKEPQENELELKQKEWFKNTNNCPACGAYVDQEEQVCRSCGLRLGKKQYYKNLDTSRYRKQSVKYHIKDDKKNKTG